MKDGCPPTDEELIHTESGPEIAEMIGVVHEPVFPKQCCEGKVVIDVLLAVSPDAEECVPSTVQSLRASDRVNKRVALVMIKLLNPLPVRSRS